MVFLINPPYSRRPTSGIYAPLGLCYIASSLRNAGAQVKIIDFCAEYPAFDFTSAEFFNQYCKKRLIEADINKAILIGIGPIVTANIEISKSIIEIIKQIAHHVHIVIGGPLSVAPGFSEISLSYLKVDSYIRGEGETPLVSLWKALSGNCNLSNTLIDGFAFSGNTPPPIYREENINLLPVPSRDLLDMSLYHSSHRRVFDKSPIATAVFSRGCQHSCIFCSAPIIGGKNVRRFNKTRMLQEFNNLHLQGIKNVIFYDNCFFLNSSNLNENAEVFISAIKESQWSGNFQIELRCDCVLNLSNNLLLALKKAGCYQVNMGIEKATNSSLKDIKKGITPHQIIRACTKLDDINIRTAGTFIFGGFGDTLKVIDETIEFASSLPLTFAHFNPLSIIPGTELFQLCFPNFRDSQWLDMVLNRSISPFGDILWDSKDLPIKYIAEKINNAYKNFYSEERAEINAFKFLNNHLQVEMLFKTYNEIKDKRGKYLIKNLSV